MATAYTPILKLALPVTGELNGTWGNVVNDNITSMVEQAVAGLATINTWTANSHTLTTANGTTSESRCAMLVIDDDGAGNPSAAATVVCPTATKAYIVQNLCGQTVTVKTAAGTGVAVPNNQSALVFCNGTNVVTGAFNGDVVGPASATDNAIVRYDGTTGKLVQNSAVTIADDGATVIEANSTSAGLRITQTGTGYTLLVEDSATDSTPFAILANGSVGVGTTNPQSIFSVSGDGYILPSFRAYGDSSGNYPTIIKGRGTQASPAAVQSGDELGGLIFQGYDGTSNIPAAYIRANVNGTPGTNDMPGRLIFATTADGASSATERMYIDNAGTVSTPDTGRIQIGSGAELASALVISRPMTGNAVVWNTYTTSSVQSDVTSQARMYVSSPTTQATTFTLPTLVGFSAQQQVFGAGSTVTNQYGFEASSALTGAINNFGFRSNIAAGTGRWNFYASGTANNYFAGNVGVGSTSLTGINFNVGADVTGATVCRAIQAGGTIKSDVTNTTYYYGTSGTTESAAFTLTSLVHYFANQSTFGAGSTVTSQFGFRANSTLTGATNNYGFYGDIASGTNRWNFYANGTASNFFGGNTIISVTDNTNAALRITQLGTGNALLVEDSANPDATPTIIDATGKVVVGHTATVTMPTGDGGLYGAGIEVLGSGGVGSSLGAALYNNAAAGFGGALSLAKSNSATIGAHALVTSGDLLGAIYFSGSDGTNFIRAAQILSQVDGTPGASDMPGRLAFSTTADGASSPTERMRIDSAGNIGIGTIAPAGYSIRSAKIVTGATAAYGFIQQGTVQSDVTASYNINQTVLSTQAAAFTLTNARHFLAAQGTIGATSAVTNQFGFFADGSLTGATNNYGFYSNIASGTGRWNFYAAGTASNYFGGNTIVEVTDNTNAALRITQLGTGNALLVEDSANPDATPFVVDSAGRVGMGITPSANIPVNIAYNLTGSTIVTNIRAIPTIQSDVTSNAIVFRSNPFTQAAAFTLGGLIHYDATQGTIGAGSAVVNQYGFNAAASLIGANNNYGFFSSIPSGTGRWNFYANGTADNYFEGNVIQKLAASVTPANNSEMMMQLTSNTSLTIKVKGTDGTVRSVSLTLA